MDPFTPATELASAVRRREVSPVELAELYLGRIDKLDPELNAFTFPDDDRVLGWARDAEAAVTGGGSGELPPFHRVPLPIKDLNRVEGWPTTYGSRGASAAPNTATDLVVQRFIDAGFVPLGMTNSPEFGTISFTESEAHGVTRNPWDPERTPGGSSGGAGAAVASGMVPLAHGSDGGGSIRIPAACCGLVGLKPTRGRISRGPDLGDDLLVQDGTLTRTVADTAEMLDILSGYEVGDTTWAPPPSRPFVEAAGSDPGKLRIGYTTASPIEAALDPECGRAVTDAAQLLAELGHEVDETPAPWDQQDAMQAFT